MAVEIAAWDNTRSAVLGTEPRLVERLMPAAVWMTLRLVDRVEPPTTADNLALGRLNPDRLLGVDHPGTLDHVRSGGLC
jgi:hypothetical protein